MDKQALRDRTIKRGLAIWKPLDPVELAADELAGQETVLNVLGQDSARQGIIAVDEATNFQAGLRDQLFELDLMRLDQDQRITFQRYLTEKQALASKEYDAQVQAIIMDAREYAATIDREGIELEKRRALMDVQKEEVHLQEVQSRIMLELFEQRNQEIDLAKVKIEVARANVRAIMADIEAEEAEVRLVRAELEVAKVEADKAELIADVALIMADIVVRGLARIRLAVETAELDAEFTFIAQRLSDFMAISQVKLDTEDLRISYEKLINAEVALMEESQREQLDLEKIRMAMVERIQAFEEAKQRLADVCAKAQKDVEEAQKEAFAQVRSNAEIELDKARTWVEMLINGAESAARQYPEVT